MDYFVEHGDKISTPALLVAIVAAFLKGVVYSGASYDKLMEEKNELRRIVDESNARDRERLERVEAKLDDALKH